METIINYQFLGKLNQVRKEIRIYNAIWGPEYLLMDSDSFMGGAGGEHYDKIIDILVKIRETSKKRLS